MHADRAHTAPHVVIVTDRHATTGRDLVEVVGSALRAMRDFPARRVAVQLREKDLGGAALLDLARRLREVTAEAGVALFVNDRVDVAMAAGADGVHLGERSLSIADARALSPVLAVAVSRHDHPGVEEAAAQGADFVVFGPVFDTPSKRGWLAPRGTGALTDVGDLGVPCVAIGGVDASNVADCMRSGATGVACIRPVMGAPDPEAALRSLLAVIPTP